MISLSTCCFATSFKNPLSPLLQTIFKLPGCEGLEAEDCFIHFCLQPSAQRLAFSRSSMNMWCLSYQTRNRLFMWHWKIYSQLLWETNALSCLKGLSFFKWPDRQSYSCCMFHQWLSACGTKHTDILTPRNLLHKYLNVAILRNRAQAANDVAVLEVPVQGYLLVQRLRAPSRGPKASVTRRTPRLGVRVAPRMPALLLAIPSSWKWSLPWSHETTQLPSCKKGDSDTSHTRLLGAQGCQVSQAHRGVPGACWVLSACLLLLPLHC